MVGIKQNRSVQDEKLVEAMFQTHHSPESRSSGGPIYGATATNLIVDARPTANAVANTARGAGTENMEYYRDAKKTYSGIDHIHAMRESLGKVVDALREADAVAASASGYLPGEAQQLAILDRQALRRSGWLRHMSNIMEAVVLIVRNVHINSSHVLIHCSDGWDRTSQLSALAQLCLDPYYRTMRGFQILVEKDWISFGHRFLDRCGHLSSEKFFTSLGDTTNGNGGADAAQAFLASVQSRFASQHHIKETSPAFHQFLECVRQLLRQFPERFEFNECFLRTMHRHLYSCQFGTFLYNCEQERRYGEDGMVPSERTASLWDFLNALPQVEKHRNPLYDSSLDDPVRRDGKVDMGVLFPNPKDVRFWYELYGRTDEEMNGRVVISQVKDESESPASVEGLDDDTSSSRGEIPLPPTFAFDSPSIIPSPSPSLSPSRSTATEGLSSSFQGLWASLPDLPQRVAEGFTSVGASTNLKASWPPAQPTPSGSNSLPQGRARNSNPTEFFSSNGVKSVWGKLSSNATAAFSAVQEAYDGVAKDSKVPSKRIGDEGNVGKTSELQPRDIDAGQSLSTIPGSSYNPWDSVKPQKKLKPALLTDNPWSTARSRSPSVRDVVDSGALATDLTVTRSPHERNTTGLSYIANQSPGVGTAPLTRSSGERKIDQEQKRPMSNIDPLGVGLF